MPAALEGIRVLDLTQIMAGPFCTMLLADLGAEVIKIENPRGGDDSRRMAPPDYNGESAAFIAMNRNKYGIAVDIRTPAGKQVLWRLIETADVLVENFRPGTMARLGTAHRLAAPYQVFATASGWIAIGAANQRNWEHLASALDRSDLLQNPKFATNADRMANLAELVETLTATLKTRTTEEWLQVLDEAGVPCGPVLTLDEVYQHPQVKARAMDSEVQHPIAGRIHAIGFPVKYSSTPGQMYRPAPVLGQHTNAMLESLGYSPEQRRQLENDGVVFDAHLEM